jgi:NADPH-dependent FMN reductase
VAGPSHDQDVQNEQGFPLGAEEFRRRLLACHGFVVASPEYNPSMPGRLRPRRIQAWREENELAGRDLMRDGRWLA